MVDQLTTLQLLCTRQRGPARNVELVGLGSGLAVILSYTTLSTNTTTLALNNNVQTIIILRDRAVPGIYSSVPPKFFLSHKPPARSPSTPKFLRRAIVLRTHDGHKKHVSPYCCTSYIALITTGWFKHIAPNLVCTRCPRRYLDIRP